MRRVLRLAGLVGWLAISSTTSAWAQSPSPSPSPGSPISGGGIGSVVGLLVIAGLVLLLVYYRRRVLEPFTERYSNPKPEEPRGQRDEGEDRPTH